MYSYEIWDKISPINGCSAEIALKEIRNSWEDIYLIKRDNMVEQIQPFSLSQYEGETIEEKAQAHIDELNKALETEQFIEEVRTGYIEGTYSDEQLAELVVSEKLTQAQADEIKQSKTEGI